MLFLSCRKWARVFLPLGLLFLIFVMIAIIKGGDKD